MHCWRETQRVIELWIGAGLLLGLASCFLMFPGLFLRRRDAVSQKEINRDWYAARSEELQAGDDAVAELLEDARLRLLQDAPEETKPPAAQTRHSNSLLLVIPLLLFVAGAYWQLGASGDIQLYRVLQAFGQDSSEEDYRQLMLMVEQRASQRPENLHYQAMLGRFYMNEADYPRAAALYSRLAEEAPGDASASAMAAQASYMAAGRVLDSESQLLAERALSVDPHQRTALGLLGMASYENGQYQAAIGYWERLLVTEDPQSSAAEMIRGVIARAREAAGEAPLPQATAPAMESELALGVSIRLELPPDAQVSASDTVFLFARNAAVESRMPIAVQRLTVANLPATLRLDDSNSMAGQKVSELEQLTVIARVSPGGMPGEENATFSAQLDALAPGPSSEPHLLVMQPVSGK